MKKNVEKRVGMKAKGAMQSKGKVMAEGMRWLRGLSK